MKKLVLIGILGSLVILSFKDKKNVKNTLTKDSLDTISTLNGFSESQANAWVTYCVGTADNNPENTQVWFRKEIIENWNKLLQEDSTRGMKTDGIRIYITRRLASNSTPTHFNNGIVIVSTLYAGDTIENGKKVKIHKDYFNHQKTADLYKLKSINGVVSHDNDSTGGALLYNTCHCDIANPCVISSDHDIPRSIAEKMAQHFHRIIIFRNGSINSRAEWFDKTMIKTIVDRMSEDTSKHIDGVRIYFARGVDTGSTNRKTKFVIVTTRQFQINATDILHKDYFDCAHPLLLSKTTLISTSDNGELCPDHCDGLTLPQP
ncbi:MAG: hypothetical protein JWQ84_2276 [Mucilaginibacter sp.]|nr:hypothetical protein [Mucilaginibacter sp.]